MAQEPIKQRVEIEDEATAKLRDIAQQEEQLADSTKRAGDEAEQAAPKQGMLQRGMEGLARSVMTLAAPFAGIGALTALYQGWRAEIEATNRELEQNAQLVRQAAEAQRDLRFLSQTPDPETIELADELAVAAGRDPNELRRTLADIRSRRPNWDTGDLRSFGQRVAETSLTTAAPTDAVANALLTVQRFEDDPRVAQNILRQTIVDAGVSDPARVSPLLAQYLSIGTGVGGLSTGEAAGAIAGVTGLGLQPETAVTGLRTVTLGLMGDTTPEREQILQDAGVDRSNLRTALESFGGAVQRGDITNQQMEVLFGREGLPVGTALARGDVMSDFLGAIDRGGQVEAMEGSLTGEAIEAQFGASMRERLDLTGRRAQTESQIIREEDEFAQVRATARNILENEIDRGIAAGRMPPGIKERALADYDRMTAEGANPFDVAGRIERFTRSRVGGAAVDADLSGRIAAELGEEAGMGPGGELDIPETIETWYGRRRLTEEEGRERLLGRIRSAAERFEESGGVTVNQINIGEQYNLNESGESRATEDSDFWDR